uniref:Uncharacterized protein n=1 Tax=viral metagenome TaxID=1070528 RepID=A0A6M3MBC2_9ZZZZ
MVVEERPKPELPEVYKGWTIYYSGLPRPLWTACKGFEKNIYSYTSLETIKGHIDKKMVKDAVDARREDAEQAG